VTDSVLTFTFVIYVLDEIFYCDKTDIEFATVEFRTSNTDYYFYFASDMILISETNFIFDISVLCWV